jgi:RimJ/RimL family protein N-acetyltransferase
VTPVTLVGERVRLEPLEVGHLAGLVAAAADPSTWTWLHAPLTDEAAMRDWLADALRARDAGAEMPFATVDAASGAVLGSTRYMAIAPAHRRLEIGWTWLAPAVQGTGVNTEAKLLLLEHAFERLGALRVELKTDALNDRSRAALAAIGATFEGVSRRHMLMANGRVRDSAWYAIVDEDWPAVRELLRARLAAQAGHAPAQAGHAPAPADEEGTDR